MKKDLDNELELTNSENELEEECEVTDLTDMRLYGILNDLDKVCAVLDKLLDDYMFCDEEEPDLNMLKDELESSDENMYGTSTEIWVKDYNTIYQFLDIVYDYADHARYELEDILFDLYDEDEDNDSK